MLDLHLFNLRAQLLDDARELCYLRVRIMLGLLNLQYKNIVKRALFLFAIVFAFRNKTYLAYYILPQNANYLPPFQNFTKIGLAVSKWPTELVVACSRLYALRTKESVRK